jgi:hypothetical protein
MSAAGLAIVVGAALSGGLHSTYTSLFKRGREGIRRRA